MSANSSILCGSLIKNQMESVNRMDEPLVPTPQPKISKSKKTPKKPKKKSEVLKKLIIETGLFVLSFDQINRIADTTNGGKVIFIAESISARRRLLT